MKKKRYKDIFEAIESNDIEVVKSFLPEHANDVNNYGFTALVYTISTKNKQIFDLLLDNGADPYAETNRYSILGFLWNYNWSDKIQEVVEHGYDINNGVLPNLTILYNLCRIYSNKTHNDSQTIEQLVTFLKELIRCGARTDIPDEDGKLPLDYLSDDIRSKIESYIANLGVERQGNIASETGFAYDI